MVEKKAKKKDKESPEAKDRTPRKEEAVGVHSIADPKEKELVKKILAIVDEVLVKWDVGLRFVIKYTGMTKKAPGEMKKLSVHQEAQKQKETFIKFDAIFSDPLRVAPVPSGRAYVHFWYNLDTEVLLFSFDCDRTVLKAQQPSSARHVKARLKTIFQERTTVCEPIVAALSFEEGRMAAANIEQFERVLLAQQVKEQAKVILDRRHKLRLRRVILEERLMYAGREHEAKKDGERIERPWLIHEGEEEDVIMRLMNGERIREDYEGQPIESDVEDKPETEKETMVANRAAIDLYTLLTHIFDSADEDDTGLLTFTEVVALFMATLVHSEEEDAASAAELREWDIRLLSSKATERDDGMVRYGPLIRKAPDIIKGLKERRKSYELKMKAWVDADPDYFSPDREVTADVLLTCSDHELMETAKVLNVLKEFQFKTETVLSRSQVRSLLQKSKRLSKKEISMVMSKLPQEVPINEDLIGHILDFRVAALQNACVESDAILCGTHLVNCILHTMQRFLNAEVESAADENTISIWNLREVLHNADQISLSLNQIHAILCCVKPDQHGFVDLLYFLKLTVVLVRNHFFDRQIYLDVAKNIERDREEDHTTVNKKKKVGAKIGEGEAEPPEGDAGEDSEKSREHLEREILQLNFSKRQIDVSSFLSLARSELVAFGLSQAEIRGFIAIAEIDGNGDIQFAEHVKQAMQVIFDLRKDPLLCELINADYIEDMAELDADQGRFTSEMLALLPKKDAGGDRGPERRASASLSVARRLSRDGSKTRPSLTGQEKRPTLT